MNSFKSLSIMQIAGLIAGALVLNKVLKTKVGVVVNKNSPISNPSSLTNAIDNIVKLSDVIKVPVDTSISPYGATVLPQQTLFTDQHSPQLLTQDFFN